MVGKRKGVSQVQRSCKKIKGEGSAAAASSSSSSLGLKTYEQRDGKRTSQILRRSRLVASEWWWLGSWGTAWKVIFQSQKGLTVIKAVFFLGPGRFHAFFRLLFYGIIISLRREVSNLDRFGRNSLLMQRLCKKKMVRESSPVLLLSPFNFFPFKISVSAVTHLRRFSGGRCNKR